MRARSHRWVRPALLVGMTWCLLDCIGPDPYACIEDTQCALAAGGQCHTNGHCSYPDERCASRRSWSKNAGSEAGDCLDDSVAGSSTGTSVGPTTEMSSSGPGTSSTSAADSGSAGAETDDIADYAQTVLSDDPVGYWRLGDPFGSVAADELSQHDGTTIGNAELGVAGLLTGDADTAARFVVEDPQGITIGPDLDLAQSGLSVEAWIDPLPQWGTWQRIVMDTDDSNGYQITITPEGDLRGILSVDGFVPSAQMDASTFMTLAESDASIHVVLTHDTNNLRLFVNGALVESTPASGSLAGNSSDLTLGADETGWNSFFGTLDEVAVYDHALPLDRVVAHYEAGTTL